MSRFLILVSCLSTYALLYESAWGDDLPKKLTTEDRKRLEERWEELNTAGLKVNREGKFPEAIKAHAAALEIARQLYSKEEYPDGHANIAISLDNLALSHKNQGDYAIAESLYKESFEMLRRLVKGDHIDVAANLNNMAMLFMDQGKFAVAEPLFKGSLEMRRRLYRGDHADVAISLNNLGALYWNQGKFADAEPLFHEVLDIKKRLFKSDHISLSYSLSNLATLYQTQGNYTDAEPLYRESLNMNKRLFKDDHHAVARSLNNLAFVYLNQGKYAEAEPLYRDALEMRKRLSKSDHPDVAQSLSHLALLYTKQGKYVEAEPLYRDSLDMYKRLFKADHSSVANSMNNLANLYQNLEKYTDAEPLYRDALDMNRRQFKGDHPAVAKSLDNLASLYLFQRNYAKAEPLYCDALHMFKRLFKGDHPEVARCSNNLGDLYLDQAKYADAELLLRDSLEMYGRLIQTFAMRKAEGEALTLIASLPFTRDAFLNTAWQAKSDPQRVYPELWASKGLVARVYEQRHQAARAALADRMAAKLLVELADTRRRRAELLLAHEVKDPATQQKREVDLKEYESKIAKLDELIRPHLPTIERAEKLAQATPLSLQKVLASDIAVIDFIRYFNFKNDDEKIGNAGKNRTARYLAFVVMRDKVAWEDLDTAESIESAVKGWREVITSGKDIPATVPAKVRELVWEKIRKQLPPSIKTVYVSPDAALCCVPWGALPGDKPGTILLQDFAVATIPHAPFLLDKLWPQDQLKQPPTGVLVVGGVKYDAELSSVPNASTIRGDPLLKPGEKVGWAFLPGTAAEATGVADAAFSKKLTVTPLKDDKATTSAIVAALPTVKYAHFATHGFFAEASFRSIFRLDPDDFKQSWKGERIGHAAKSPLVMTGLVCAGANTPKTLGRGIVTGEALIDLDLSGLELAVLSACETGLGDVAGGEGTFGLQRAFHMAGTRDVVVSLWKVPDQSTAALMALFYHNLWTLNLSPVESLRQAQLEIYCNPAKIPELAKGFRGKFEEVSGSGGVSEIKSGKDGKAHPLLWAAFTLSGPGK
jgi:CHAT domain-containing protein/tetratricopeptide (TPR) repeat protein